MTAELGRSIEWIALRHARYIYSRTGRGVYGASLAIRPGRTMIVGRNGSGKSTVLKLLATVLRPSAGELIVDGRTVHDAESLRQARRQIGYVPQDDEGVAHLTVHQEISYAAWLKGIGRRERAAEVDRCLELVQIPDDYRRSRRQELSGGFARRVSIAAAMVGDPAILVLDEPTAALDVEVAESIASVLAQWGQRKALIMSSHQVPEVARLADRIVVVQDGWVRDPVEAGGFDRAGAVRRLMAGEGLDQC